MAATTAVAPYLNEPQKGFRGPDQSSDQRGDDAGDAAKDCRGDPLCFGEVVHQAERTCAGAMGYRKCF